MDMIDNNNLKTNYINRYKFFFLQIPIFEVRSDGRDNFLSSLIFVGHYCIPEVII